MDFSAATFWWVAAGLAVAAELATGTFYLLMMALGLAAAAVAAHLGLPLAGQIVAAAIVGGGATALWHWRRFKQPTTAPARENRDVNLDIGERVHVAKWAADRTTRVTHRGSVWTARLAPGATPTQGEYVVSAVEGNWLVLAPAASSSH
ncbi:MAG: membrane protein implicated in regulation of membrane protease activity [Methylibium sp. NZG]|nr:MAG: membrane protein implicated in regulation of membrane protease activity [Methylibium sp. NZG]